MSCGCDEAAKVQSCWVLESIHDDTYSHNRRTGNLSGSFFSVRHELLVLDFKQSGQDLGLWVSLVWASLSYASYSFMPRSTHGARVICAIVILASNQGTWGEERRLSEPVKSQWCSWLPLSLNSFVVESYCDPAGRDCGSVYHYGWPLFRSIFPTETMNVISPIGTVILVSSLSALSNRPF